MERLKEIEARKAEIKSSIESLNDKEEVRKLTEEVEQLNLEERDLREKEERAEISKKLENGEIEAKEVEIENKEEKKMEKNFDISSKEYRSAFLKKLQGKELDAEERAVVTSATTEGNAGKAIPTETENSIFEKISKKAPLLDEVTLLHVRGNVDFVVEGERTDGADHAEGVNISESGVNLVKVSLAGAEIVKLVTISETVKSMTIDAFEDWLTDMLSDSIANAIEGKIAAAVETNGTQLAKAVDADSIREAVGTLPASYDSGAKFLVNKRQFFTEILGLQDKAKNDLVTYANGKYYILGYEVMTSDKATKVTLGNFKKFVANMPQDVQVKSAYNIGNNTYSYSGVAMYDGKVALADAFVVIAGE